MKEYTERSGPNKRESGVGRSIGLGRFMTDFIMKVFGRSRGWSSEGTRRLGYTINMGEHRIYTPSHRLSVRDYV